MWDGTGPTPSERGDIPRVAWEVEIVKRIKRLRLPAVPARQQGALARRMLGVAMKFGADSEICGEGEPVEFVYEVMTGAVRTVKILPDGRRQVCGFHFAGDIFGLEDGNVHALSAEAVGPATIRVIKRRTLVRLAADDCKLAEDLLTASMCEVARAQRHALMLVMTAQERVNGFLVEMMERISAGDLVRLPMSRRDIADYLSLTIETVSRTITGMAVGLTIHLPSSRTIVLRNRSALERGTGAKVGMLSA
jgi:CRP/FNR family nitrogen fixation transcriptional regulator